MPQFDLKAQLPVHTMSCTDRDGMCYHVGTLLSRGTERAWVGITSRPGQKVKNGAIRGKNEEGLREVWKAMSLVESDEKCTFLLFSSPALGSAHQG